MEDPWARVTVALTLLAVDPAGLRGLWLRARAGPVRARVQDALVAFAPRKLHPSISDDALFGGLDLAATLGTGTMHHHAGLLGEGGILVLTMAERCPPALAVRLAQALDAQTDLGLIALDETAQDGEGLAPALCERLGLFLDLDALAWADTGPFALPMDQITQARARLSQVRITHDARTQVTGVAAALGIDSMRAPLLTLAAARAHAAWRGATELDAQDLALAVALVLAHRATAVPDAPPDDTPPPPPPQPSDDAAQTPPDTDGAQDIPDDMLIDAARAALPAGVLAKLQAGRVARAVQGQSSSGAVRKSKRRGRPLPSRAGALDSAGRVDVVATLRQAAPWQKLRRQSRPDARAGQVLLMPSDIRVRHFRAQTDRVLIFVVDASGSSALARLAEAKGAIELMLADAYATRDHVALVSFRGRNADLSLAPTRSLVQAKRQLAGLPGGGGTPLAGGLQVALETALHARGHGMAPTLALLTDGRGNIALDGSADRAAAGTDAVQLAQLIARQGIPALVIDTGLRPNPHLASLSAHMGATQIALPRADARALSATLSAAFGD
ncbi:magnesium chelatase subunit D [Roseinatronobacter sp. S2]|uniref:magnesium chelatase subunit D n=1 Tax=Roseinatronobacter sp. S2 TaxID=3035471 RepID=UPI00240FC9DD|nr:magnesium chelatase subunit D [Roseinatronobacter sp. S2]WFE76786.1 magnesium chelatase subunit D [Roseinatronobacter sp. S2]